MLVRLVIRNTTRRHHHEHHCAALKHTHHEHQPGSGRTFRPVGSLSTTGLSLVWVGSVREIGRGCGGGRGGWAWGPGLGFGEFGVRGGRGTISSLFPLYFHYFRLISALFPPYFRSISALFPWLPPYFRCTTHRRGLKASRMSSSKDKPKQSSPQPGQQTTPPPTQTLPSTLAPRPPGCPNDGQLGLGPRFTPRRTVKNPYIVWNNWGKDFSARSRFEDLGAFDLRLERGKPWK